MQWKITIQCHFQLVVPIEVPLVLLAIGTTTRAMRVKRACEYISENKNLICILTRGYTYMFHIFVVGPPMKSIFLRPMQFPYNIYRTNTISMIPISPFNFCWQWFNIAIEYGLQAATHYLQISYRIFGTLVVVWYAYELLHFLSNLRGISNWLQALQTLQFCNFFPTSTMHAVCTRSLLNYSVLIQLHSSRQTPQGGCTSIGEDTVQ